MTAAPTALRVLDAVLAAGAAARLVRFVVIEDAGGWLIRDPADRWADRHEPTIDGVPVHQLVEQGKIEVEQPVVPGWRSKLVSGLDCPFCVGTWLHIGTQLTTAFVPPQGHKRSILRAVTAGLTASWVLGHIGSRLGDAGYAED